MRFNKKLFIILLISSSILMLMFLHLSAVWGPRAVVEIRLEKTNCNGNSTNVTWNDLNDVPTLKNVFQTFLKDKNKSCKYRYETTIGEWKKIKRFIEEKGKYIKINKVCIKIDYANAMLAD